MKINYVNSFFMVLIFGLVLQSCSTDENLLTEETVEELKKGGSKDQGVDRIDNDLIYEWNNQMLAVEQYSFRMRPNASARAIAYINLAIYETAVSGMRNNISTVQSLNGLEIKNNQRPNQLNYELAINAAYANVLDHFMINLPEDKRKSIEEFEIQQEAKLSSGNISNNLKENSIKWGEYVAQQVIAYSQTDSEAEKQILDPQPTSYEPPTGDGYWTYSADPERALFPYWKSVRTFIVSTDETTTVPPLKYSADSNTPYNDEMMETYTVNNAAKTTDPEQLWIAEFWSDDVENIMISPPARQVSIANQLIKEYDLNLTESLTLLVKVGFALNDAAVSTWKYKYEHMVMRPSNYIHKFIDPDFQTNLYRLIYWPNPSFPGYPSGHSCFASAAGGIFIDFFGDQTNFTDRTYEDATDFQGTPRSFSRFSDMAEENAFSRIPLGVHIRMDCAEGLRLGYEISDGINELKLNRKPS